MHLQDARKRLAELKAAVAAEGEVEPAARLVENEAPASSEQAQPVEVPPEANLETPPPVSPNPPARRRRIRRRKSKLDVDYVTVGGMGSKPDCAEDDPLPENPDSKACSSQAAPAPHVQIKASDTLILALPDKPTPEACGTPAPEPIPEHGPEEYDANKEDAQDPLWFEKARTEDFKVLPTPKKPSPLRPKSLLDQFAQAAPSGVLALPAPEGAASDDDLDFELFTPNRFGSLLQKELGKIESPGAPATSETRFAIVSAPNISVE